MVYNSHAYMGIRIAQLLSTVVILLVVGLIVHLNGYPWLVFGILPPNHRLTFATLLCRVFFTLGSLFLYPLLSLFSNCYILSCTKTFKPQPVSICLDVSGIISYLATGIIFITCIKENKSPVQDLVDTNYGGLKTLNYMYFLPKFVRTINTAINNFQTIPNDGIDLKQANDVMIGCLVYFAIQVNLCAICIYLAIVYKKSNQSSQQRQFVCS